MELAPRMTMIDENLPILLAVSAAIGFAFIVGALTTVSLDRDVRSTPNESTSLPVAADSVLIVRDPQDQGRILYINRSTGVIDGWQGPNQPTPNSGGDTVSLTRSPEPSYSFGNSVLEYPGNGGAGRMPAGLSVHP